MFKHKYKILLRRAFQQRNRGCVLVIAICIAAILLHSPRAVFASEKLTVYTKINKHEIATLSLDRVQASSEQPAYYTVEITGDWEIIQFHKPFVPVWVSSAHVSKGGSETSVLAGRLNMRLNPNKTAPVLASVSRGYKSPVSARRNGFVQILAPTWLQFAIRKDSTANTRFRQAAPDIAESSQVKSSKQAERERWQTFVGNDSVKQTQKNSPRSNSRQSSDSIDPTGDTSAENLVVDEGSMFVDGGSPVLGETPSGTPKVNRATNKISDAASTFPSQVNGLHRLAPGDTISLIVFGEEDLGLNRIRIPQSGQVSFPLIGSVNVAGNTTAEVEKIIRDKLSGGFVRDPKLTVSVDNYRPIFVLGEVNSIGSFLYSEGLTIAKAVATAGGAKNTALRNGVSISRDGAVIQEGLSIDSEFPVLSGDIINIKTELGASEEAGFYVYLHGEVARPGEYQFRRGLTIEKAVVLAGGFSLRASRKKVSISRISDGEQEPVKLKKVPLHTPVLPGDIIDVGARWF